MVLVMREPPRASWRFVGDNIDRVKESPSILPAHIGLPAKFSSFRRGQEATFLSLLETERRFSLLSAPTGTGKSLIYMALARATGWRTLVLVGTKGLQQQLTADFAEAGMVDMRGAANYPCVAVREGASLAPFGRDGAGCDEGPCRVGIWCDLKKGGCLYYDAQAQAARSQIVVTNYAYWLSLGRHSDPNILGPFDLVVLDEAHTAPDWLNDFCAVDLDRREVKRYLDLELPPIDEGTSVWVSWAKSAAQVARDKYAEVKEALEHSISPKDIRSLTRRLLDVMRIGRSLAELSSAGSWMNADAPKKDSRMPGLHTDWVVEKTTNGLKFSPVWAHAYAEQYLFRGIPNVVLSSATLFPDAIMRYLGIDSRDSALHEVKSSFDPRRRPFIHINGEPRIRVDFRITEGAMRLLVNRIDAIIDDRQDRKGIIHTRSYRWAQILAERSRHRDILMTHTSKDSRRTIERFRTSAAPSILVSPSVEEGFDFPGELCRYQIVLKVPFIDGRSPLAKARKKSDKDYPSYVAALALVQMVGRGMRSDDDYCETFILDDHWSWFRNKVKFPEWFKRAWQVLRKAPPPLDPENLRGSLPSQRRCAGGHGHGA